jgi:vacuolar-type H+-ATPase subunit H
VQPGDQREQEFLDEIHMIEEEIDLYLKKKEQKANRILHEASRQAEEIKVKISGDAQEEFEHLHEVLIRKAERESKKILEEGSRAVMKEKTVLEEMRAIVTKKIMNHLLGRDE